VLALSLADATTGGAFVRHKSTHSLVISSVGKEYVILEMVSNCAANPIRLGGAKCRSPPTASRATYVLWRGLINCGSDTNYLIRAYKGGTRQPVILNYCSQSALTVG